MNNFINLGDMVPCKGSTNWRVVFMFQFNFKDKFKIKEKPKNNTS